MTDYTTKRDRRDRVRAKRRPVHGRSLIHVINALQKRAKQSKQSGRTA